MAWNRLRSFIGDAFFGRLFRQYEMADSTRETEEVEAIIAVRARACNRCRVVCPVVDCLAALAHASGYYISVRVQYIIIGYGLAWQGGSRNKLPPVLLKKSRL